jgi:acetyl-CoA/propionyl-CoA carboxylase, biotin carboxylase, biotin carboxyl carrier protein
VQKVLIADRGEISVRIARACRDAGLASVSVYTEPDFDQVHTRASDETYAAGSYLDVAGVLEIARRSGADAVHPGYGFLSENASFAAAVIAAGLTWIGPPPEAIALLGDKVRARGLAARIGIPVVPGSGAPVGSAEEVAAFAREHGLPIAIKAVHGGGGRGMRVVRDAADIPESYAASTRAAAAAFGDGACFVERYVERPRHVEVQCLADSSGEVVALSTRDCSVQRRHQKLIEEAPAPFLEPALERLVRESARELLREGGYRGAGTCEFLVGADGTVTFLEVNPRLQVEHPVTEEVTGIDIVLEQFRIASGEALGYGDPPVRGHAVEFRITAEDAGRAFLPGAGTVTRWRPPGGPGVRIDAGYEAGASVPQEYDSLLAKLIVTGRDRRQALARARRALGEFRIEGLPTTLPFHEAAVCEPAFAGDPFALHTRWAETEFAAAIPPWEESGTADRRERIRFAAEVDGRRVNVVLPPGLAVGRAEAGAAPPPRGRAPRRTRSAAGADAVTAPMQGTIVKVAAAEGTRVDAGDPVLVLEAMKMEQPLTAHRSGTVTDLAVAEGQTVAADAVLYRITD